MLVSDQIKVFLMTPLSPVGLSLIILNTLVDRPDDKTVDNGDSLSFSLTF